MLLGRWGRGIGCWGRGVSGVFVRSGVEGGMGGWEEGEEGRVPRPEVS